MTGQNSQSNGNSVFSYNIFSDSATLLFESCQPTKKTQFSTKHQYDLHDSVLNQGANMPVSRHGEIIW